MSCKYNRFRRQPKIFLSQGFCLFLHNKLHELNLIGILGRKKLKKFHDPHYSCQTIPIHYLKVFSLWEIWPIFKVVRREKLHVHEPPMHVVYFFLSVRELIMSEVEGRVPEKYHTGISLRKARKIQMRTTWKL